MIRTAAAWLTTVALFAASALLEARVDTRLGPFRAQEEVLYFTSGDQLKWLAPGFEGLLADVYWLRTVQYFGRAIMRRRGGPEIRALVPLVEITILLDPKFREAYLSGATFIGEPPPIGPGDPQAAVRILERGAVELPNDWIVQQHLGYGIFILLKDNKRAADRLLRASKLPGAPFWLETLAAGLLAEGGERDKARLVWKKMQEESDGPLRELARRNLLRLDALEVVEQLNRRVALFKESRGRWPESQAEQHAITDGLPLVDPTGVPFVFNATRGEFDMDESSVLWSAWAASGKSRQDRRP